MARGRPSRNPLQGGQGGGTEAKRGQSHGFGVPRGRALPWQRAVAVGMPRGRTKLRGEGWKVFGTEGLEKLSPRQSTHSLGARPRFICPTLQNRIQKCTGLCWVRFLRDLGGGSRSENADFPPIWGRGGGGAGSCGALGEGAELSPAARPGEAALCPPEGFGVWFGFVQSGAGLLGGAEPARGHPPARTPPDSPPSPQGQEPERRLQNTSAAEQEQSVTHPQGTEGIIWVISCTEIRKKPPTT